MFVKLDAFIIDLLIVFTSLINFAFLLFFGSLLYKPDTYDNKINKYAFIISATLADNRSFSPNLISASQINYKISKNLNMSLLSKYVSKQYMGNIDSKLSILPSYLISDLNFSYVIEPLKFLKKISFSFLMNNFLNF